MIWSSKATKARIEQMETQWSQLVAHMNDLLAFLPEQVQTRACGEQPVAQLRLLSEYLHDLKNTEQKRSWSMNGIKQLVDTIRGSSDNINELASNLTGFVVKYVNLYQGGLFLVREHNGEKALQLYAHYAGNRLRQTDRVLSAENGMLGQCHQDGKTVYCENVPKNYCKISSGLGDSNATSLLITPLKLADHVVGVMEFASFHKLAPEEIGFVERCAEIIASRLVKAQESVELQALRGAYRTLAEEVTLLRRAVQEADAPALGCVHQVREATIL